MPKKIVLLLLFSFVISGYAHRNVVLIIADDLGRDYCDIYSDHGPSVVNLTNVRRLLTRGVVFNNAWSNPLCSPTRAGILTGRYSFRTGEGDVVDCQLIYNGNEIENQDFSSLANGIYFLKIIDKSNSTIKLIKE
jgi:hypothetical protein